MRKALGKKKTKIRYIWLGLSRDFSLLGRLMKTLISKPKMHRKKAEGKVRKALGKKKTKIRYIWLGLSRDFSLLGRLMKTLISRHFAKYATNFLLMM